MLCAVCCGAYFTSVLIESVHAVFLQLLKAFDDVLACDRVETSYYYHISDYTPVATVVSAALAKMKQVGEDVWTKRVAAA